MAPSNSLLSPSAEPVRIDPADQKEIDAIWAEVQAKVVELAGGDPRKVQKNLTIDGVLRYVDDTQKADDKKSARYGTFKSVVGKTLQCIQTVGGIVSSGVSNVFAPAGMAYNALSFVISAWQGYQETFASLGELLEKCVEFFERLESYQGRMDSKLIRLASQNLRLFVQICDRCIKMRKTKHKIFRFAEQLFLGDPGVSDLLGMMDRLNSKEGLLVGAQTYRIVSDTAGDVKLILNELSEQKEMRREDEAKKWRRTIAKSLGFPGTALDSDGEPIPTWQRAFDTRLNSLVEDTGSWWKDVDSISKWALAPSVQEPLLLLSGKGGTGKTSMMANMIKSIRRLGSEGPTTRAVAAYYFIDGDKRKPDDVNEGDFLESVSRTLLWQIGTSYEAMTRSMASAVDRAGQFNGSLHRWDQLFFNNKESENTSTTFYLFVDATDSRLVPLLQRFMKSAARTQTRIFLTGRPEMVVDHLNAHDTLRFATVPVTEHNGPDIKKYITYSMDKMPILRDVSRQGISDWRKIILETLEEKCEGDYFKLTTSLNALAKVDLVEDIREVLEEAGKTRLAQIDAELRRLNSIRTIKEIREINEIITWIDTGRWYFNIETMEAILSVKHHAPALITSSSDARPGALGRRQTASSGSALGGPTMLSTISLLPLAQKLREKYPIFSLTDSGLLDWRSSEIQGRIPIQGHQHQQNAGKTAKTTTEGEGGPQQPSRVIQESEIAIVKHFLGNVCPTELYDRFEFEEFFNTKLGARNKDYISLDPDNAHVKIIFTSLVILTEVELRRNETLRYYAVYWLMEHMEEVDLSAADRELKGQVGPLLVKLFTEDVGIDSLFWPFDLNVSAKTWDQGEAFYLREARIEWVYSSSGVQELARWLRDSSVTKYITSDVGISFVNGIKAPGVNMHKAVLSHAARRIAEHLFVCIGFLKRQFLAGCCFLRGYLARIEGREMSDELKLYRDAESAEYAKMETQSFALKELYEIESWCCMELSDVDEKERSEKRRLLEEMLHSGSSSIVVGAVDADEAKDVAMNNVHHRNDVEQSLWEIHGALLAFQLCSDRDQNREVSTRRAQRALDLNPENWSACHFVSSRPSTTNEKGIELLTRAKDALDAVRGRDETWMRDSNNSALIARITMDLGNKLWETGQFALAAQRHRESLGYEYINFATYGKVLARYQGEAQWGELIAFVETLNKTREIWDAYFDEMVADFVDSSSSSASRDGDWENSTGNNKNLELFAEAADATDRWDVVKTFFDIATKIGTEQKAYDLLFLLRGGYARVLELAMTMTTTTGSSSSGTGRTIADENLIVSERVAALALIKSNPTDTLPKAKIAEVTDSLARVYVDRAFRPNTSDETVQALGVLLAGLLPDASNEFDYSQTVTLCHFIRFHHKLDKNDKSPTARLWIRRIVRAGIELLSDADEDNDQYAYGLLALLFTTVEDNRNNRIAWTMQSYIKDLALSKWGEYVTSPVLETSSAAANNKIRPPFPIMAALDDSGDHENSNIKHPDSLTSTSLTNSGEADETDRSQHDSSNIGRPPLAPISPSRGPDNQPQSQAQIAPPVRSDSMTRTVTNGSEKEGLPTGSRPLPPARIATNPRPVMTISNNNNSNNGKAPKKPTPFVWCDGVCGKQWTTLDEPLLSCADCVGVEQLCRDCHALLLRSGRLGKKGFHGSAGHAYVEVPAWDAERFVGMPPKCVPLPDDVGPDGRPWIALEGWKNELRKMYLPEEVKA